MVCIIRDRTEREDVGSSEKQTQEPSCDRRHTIQSYGLPHLGFILGSHFTGVKLEERSLRARASISLHQGGRLLYLLLLLTSLQKVLNLILHKQCQRAHN